ncbi:iron-sulfur cluster-binding protein [Tricladium varicosporioides]|nr:iron-sulfur cluster-binding protein [Hymenoscyphus varicosporioides]
MTQDSKTSTTTSDPIDAAPQSLPSSWYRSIPMFELERRAIYSRKWMLVTHKLRFSKAGNYVRFTEAGFSFFLCMNRQGELNGFHNICRHRAFPIVSRDSGSVSIFSCKYHGWSYGLNGKLAKAPRFETVPTFNKEKNGLFPVHVHIDAMGFVWVNLEAEEVPSAPWGEDFDGVDLQDRYSQFDVSKYRFDHEWGMKGEYNWKTLADNYNECYHCSVAHPGVAAISDLAAYSVNTAGGHIQHFSKAKPGKPNVPTSATTTSMEYEVYRHIESSDEAFTEINVLYKQVLKEDKDLCDGAQRNLNAGIFTNGKLHPLNEKGPLYFQKLVKSTVMAHRAEEKTVGGEIWPAKPKVEISGDLEDEINFCDELSCEKVPDELAW